MKVSGRSMTACAGLLFALCVALISLPVAYGQTASVDQIHDEGGSTSSIASSLVEGGLPDGTADQGGNVDADPMLVDADGADNIVGSVDDELRVQIGSPAINAGNSTLLPADRFDLDGDGNRSEPIPIDIAGGDRIVGQGGGAGASWHLAPKRKPRQLKSGRGAFC